MSRDRDHAEWELTESRGEAAGFTPTKPHDDLAVDLDGPRLHCHFSAHAPVSAGGAGYTGSRRRGGFIMTTLFHDAAAIEVAAPELTPLIDRLEFALRDRPGGLVAATRAADCLSGRLPTPDILTADDRLGDPAAYRQHVLYVNRDVPFSIVALVWRAGQQTAIHDHRCWGAVAVMQGAEHETLYSLRAESSRSQLVPGRETTYPAGDISAFAPPGDIHHVENCGPGVAISLHIYGADIALHGSSIRRSYDDDLVVAA
jgi:predicted metal-dependent enzyme (double-stranded beta helix superfamily)